MSEGVITPLSGQLAQQSAPSGQPCGDWTRQTGAGKEPVRRLAASPRSAQVSSASANGKQFSPIR